MKSLSALMILITFVLCTNALQEKLTPKVPGKSTTLEQERRAPFDNGVLNKNNEQQLQRKSVDVNEFKETAGFPDKGREKRSGYYWHENRHRKKKFRPSPLIWG